jgi:hypothetical protein
MRLNRKLVRFRWVCVRGSLTGYVEQIIQGKVGVIPGTRAIWVTIVWVLTGETPRQARTAEERRRATIEQAIDNAIEGIRIELEVLEDAVNKHLL